MIGKKVTFTSRANQEMFGVREPIYGQLLDRGAHAEGVPIMASTLIDPVVDCELAFIIRRRLGACPSLLRRGPSRSLNARNTCDGQDSSSPPDFLET